MRPFYVYKMIKLKGIFVESFYSVWNKSSPWQKINHGIEFSVWNTSRIIYWYTGEFLAVGLCYSCFYLHLIRQNTVHVWLYFLNLVYHSSNMIYSRISILSTFKQFADRTETRLSMIILNHPWYSVGVCARTRNFIFEYDIERNKLTTAILN